MSDLLAAIRGLPNAAEPLEGWVTGGQPTAAHLPALHAAGCQVILDNRDPMEPRPFDEPKTVRQLGMEYVNVSVRQGALDDQVMGAAGLIRVQWRGQSVCCLDEEKLFGALKRSLA